MDLKEINLQSQNRHPWEIVRAEFIVEEISKIKPNRIIDVGSGDGYLGNRISETLGIPVLSVDSNFPPSMLEKPGHFQQIIQIAPADGDLIVLADVLEHVAEPGLFLKEMSEHFMANTSILITVPAFQALFSKHDSFLGHYRRYNKTLLVEHASPYVKLSKTRYFFVIPLIVRFFQIVAGKKNYEMSVSSWNYSPLDPRTLLVKLILELDLCLSLLPGLSLLAVGRLRK